MTDTVHMFSDADVPMPERAAETGSLADRSREEASKVHVCKWRDCRQPIVGAHLRSAVRLGVGLMHRDCFAAQTAWLVELIEQAKENGTHSDEVCFVCHVCRNWSNVMASRTLDAKPICMTCAVKSGHRKSIEQETVDPIAGSIAPAQPAVLEVA
jgi:hypothetical protein